MRLRSAPVANPKEKWITKSGAFAPVVPIELFDAVQAKLDNATVHLTNEEMLSRLRKQWLAAGYLSVRSVDRSRSLPSATAYRDRFGSLRNALQQVGYPVGPKRVDRRTLVAELKVKTWTLLTDSLRRCGIPVNGVCHKNYEIKVPGLPRWTLRMAYFQPGSEQPTWMVPLPRKLSIGPSVLGLLSADYRSVEQFIITPRLTEKPVLKFQLTMKHLQRRGVTRFGGAAEFPVIVQQMLNLSERELEVVSNKGSASA